MCRYDNVPGSSRPTCPNPDPLQLAVAGYLARFKGISRTHAESDLRVYLRWCDDRQPRPARRVRGRTSSCTCGGCRRSAGSSPPPSPGGLSVVAGFYRTCVIDGVLEHSPAEYVRRPRVPAESPTLGLTHLQFEALLTAARQSPNPYDFALVCLLGLLGLRIFEATGARHRRPRRGTRPPRPARRRQGRQGRPHPAATGRRPRHRPRHRRPQPAARSCSTRRGARMDRHAATRRLRRLAAAAGMRMPRMHPHMLRHTFVTTMLDAGVDLRDVQIAARHADPRTTMRYDRARKNLDRHPNYILAAYMASGT